MRTNKVFLLLALLLTAATGAWAQTTYTVVGSNSAMFGSAWDADATANDMTKNSDGTYSITYTDVYLDGDVQYKVVENRDWGNAYPDADRVIKITEAGTYTFTIHFNPTTHEVYETKPGYTVSLKDGVKDADKWTITPNEGLSEGDQVTIQYTGRLKVKGVKATSDAAEAVTGNTVDLSTLTADYEAQDGDVLTGTLAEVVKITIADGATVTLSGAVINGTNTSDWAGLTLAGDGTIILSGENSVKGFYEDHPGISVPANKTLTIQGDGSLTASSNGYGAGIGGGYDIACGNITIEGGTITATGGSTAAGIGGGRNTSCGNISITGGTVTATGGNYAAGIGGGYKTSCGDITIANTVTKVTATKGDNATNSIGVGMGGSCGTVTIGGNVGAITESPYTYQPSN